MRLIVAADPAAAAEAGAVWIARRLRGAVGRRGAATVAFSGGSTPALMLDVLARLDVPWPSVHAYQVDERVAPDGDPARNVRLLDVLPIARANLHAMPVAARDLRRGARRYGAALPHRLDVVHLGVGDDGHTASWPPGDPVIDAVDPVALCDPYAGFVRMTLTPPAVNAARARLVLAVGSSKRPVLERWLHRDRTLPVARVRRTGTTLVLDAAATPRGAPAAAN
jgi:6-phosphogluconolactonase